MVRTQIYLTRHEQDRLKYLAVRTGRSLSELIREAVDQWLDRHQTAGRQQVLDEVVGIWRERTDLPDFGAIRREGDRQPDPDEA